MKLNPIWIIAVQIAILMWILIWKAGEAIWQILKLHF